MGLSIHYNGSFSNPTLLSEMIEEVKDIVNIYEWEYTIYEEQFPLNSFEQEVINGKIYGISFSPDNCETIHLSFLSNGKMSSIFHLELYGNTANVNERQYLYLLSTKTQFAGMDTHKLIIHLLKYLSKKYFSTFNLMDEGQYWERGNEELLKKNFDHYNDLMDTVASAFQNYPISSGEPFELYFERILNLIHSRKQKPD